MHTANFGNFDLLNDWRQDTVAVLPKSQSASTYEVKLKRHSMTGAEDVLGWSSSWARIVMRPQSAARMAWDATSLMLLLFDVLWIPLLVFEPDDEVDLT